MKHRVSAPFGRAIQNGGRRLRVAGAVVGVAALGLGAAACGGGDGASSGKQVAFAQPDTSSAIYPLLLQGAKAEAKQRGYQLLESHANHQLDRQVNELNTWIGQQVNGIMVLPLDNNAMGPVIKKAHQSNVKILDYSDKALPGVDGWVTFDNPQGAKLVGEDAGRWVNKTLGGKAKVALLT